MKTHLLIIDPQNSFCSLEGELYVPNAEKDMTKLAAFIEKHQQSIDSITVTLDSHNRIHIAHPIWWINSEGKMPEPFTPVSLEDVKNKVWTPKNPDTMQWSLSYLEKNTTHMIWPPHCIIGTWGHEVFASLKSSLDKWADTNPDLDYYFKGFSRFTEHYSAVKPCVPVDGDPGSLTNRVFIEKLHSFDRILVAGEASSHCVADTVKDMVLLDESLAGKIVLIKDGMSPVSGFETNADAFISNMVTKGAEFKEFSNIF